MINKQEAHGLADYVKLLKNTIISAESELDTLKTRHEQLMKELEEVNSAITQHEISVSTSTVDMAKKRKQVSARVIVGKQINQRLNILNSTADEDQECLQTGHALHVECISSIRSLLGL